MRSFCLTAAMAAALAALFARNDMFERVFASFLPKQNQRIQEKQARKD
jgi:hypothetical protein